MQKIIEPGFILINKPVGRTSFSVVAQIKRLLREAGVKKPKVGHAGTIDPFATGLLIIAIGREATRCMKYLLRLDKQYCATVQFGLLTDTLDGTGKILQENGYIPKSIDEITQAIESIGSKYMQIPPIYSALKFQGSRLYHVARKNLLTEDETRLMLEKKQREVTIHDIAIDQHENNKAIISTHVSHGTYVRSLMNDIAKKMNTVGTTVALKRTKIGQWKSEDSHDIDIFADYDQLQKYVIKVSEFKDILDLF